MNWKALSQNQGNIHNYIWKYFYNVYEGWLFSGEICSQPLARWVKDARGQLISDTQL